MKVILIVVAIGLVSVCFLTIMSLCKVASMADSMYDMNFNNFIKERN